MGTIWMGKEKVTNPCERKPSLKSLCDAGAKGSKPVMDRQGRVCSFEIRCAFPSRISFPPLDFHFHFCFGWLMDSTATQKTSFSSLVKPKAAGA